MDDRLWITLSYTLPMAPSGNRVYVWRKLRGLGAASLHQGVAVLPDSRANVQKLLELAERIRQMGGEATALQMRFVEEADSHRMVESFRRQSAQEYRQLLLDTSKLCDVPPEGGHSRSGGIKRRYQQVKSRDFFGAGEGLDSSDPLGGLLQRFELDLDGGWGQLLEELRQGFSQLSRAVSGRDAHPAPEKEEVDP